MKPVNSITVYPGGSSLLERSAEMLFLIPNHVTLLLLFNLNVQHANQRN